VVWEDGGCEAPSYPINGMTMPTTRRLLGRVLLMAGTAAAISAVMVWVFLSPATRELYFSARFSWTEDLAEKESLFRELSALDLPRERMVPFVEDLMPRVIAARGYRENGERIREMTKRGWGRGLAPVLAALAVRQGKDQDAILVELARIGPEAGVAVPSLCRLLKECTGYPRAGANDLLACGRVAEALAEMGPGAAGACEDLLAAMRRIVAEIESQGPRFKGANEDPRDFHLGWACGQVLQALAAARPRASAALPLLRKMLAAPWGDDVAWRTGEALAALGEAGEEVLLELTRSPDPLMRERGVRSLQIVDPLHPEIIPTLLRAIEDDDLEVRRHGAAKFYHVSERLEDDADAARALSTAFLRERDPDVRQNLLEGIAYTQRVASELVPALLAALRRPCRPLEDGDWALRRKEALLPEEEARLANLRAALLQCTAAWACSYVPAKSDEVLDALRRTLADAGGYERARSNAAAALGRWGEQGAEDAAIVDALLDALGDADEGVRLEVAWSLQYFPAHRARILPRLQSFIAADDGGRDQNCAAYARMILDRDRAAAVRVYLRNLTAPTGEEEYQRRDSRWHSLWLLGKVGAEARVAADAVRPFLAGGMVPTHLHFADLDDRGAAGLAMQAMYTLWRLEGNLAGALALYTNNLACRDASLRQSAAEWLGCMGGAARPALPALARVQEDAEARVRHAAHAAAERIRSGAPAVD